MSTNEDSPPNSRLFIVCSKKDELTEDDFKETFSPFGTIEDIWFVRDKQSSRPRGLCYVKFSKSSEACVAMEKMNGECMKNSDLPLKIIMAANRSEGSIRKSKEAEALNRIFIVVPEDYKMARITEHFSTFGEITNSLEVRNGKFAYLTFSKASEAALAIEECDRLLYKPRIADPPTNKRRRERSPSPAYSRPYRESPPPPPRRQGILSSRSYGSYVDAIPGDRFGDSAVFDLSLCLINNPTRCCNLYLKVNYQLSRGTLWKLCGLIPGLEQLELHDSTGVGQNTVAYVKYNSPASAAWAWEKLQDFEYPPGFPIRVRYTDAGLPPEWISMDFTSNVPSSDFRFHGSNSFAGNGYQDFSSSATRSRADSVISPINHIPPRTTAVYGPPLPMLSKETEYADRCFFTCTSRIPQTVLEDCFSSFGSLIEVFYLGNKNCGFVTFGSVDAAANAINALNGTMLYGEKIKVIRADPEPNRGDARN